MTLRKSSLLSLGAFLLVATSAMAADEFAQGMDVARELVAPEGHRFLFTVTPPPDRGVDPRIFDMFELEDRAEKGANIVGMPKKEKDVESDDVEALDVSGYTVRIEQAGAAAASCRLQVPFVKFKKAKLKGGFGFITVSTGASAMFGSSYPVKGDVDAVILRGDQNTGTLCSRSTKGVGQFDLAKCSEGSCNTAGSQHTGIIANLTSSEAEFVGAITVTFVQ